LISIFAPKSPSMKFQHWYWLLVFLFVACKKEVSLVVASVSNDEIQYAKGFSLKQFEDFSILTVNDNWSNSENEFVYILHKANVQIPDSLQNYTSIEIPVSKIVVTSTTHVPSLEALGVESTLKAFPTTDYISSEKTRALIDAGKVIDVGSNQSMNTELLLDLEPEVVVGIGITDDTKTYSNLQKNGLKVLYNGDWAEQSPLGKAEWIKFFGALYDLDGKAKDIFETIEKEYLKTKKIATNSLNRPTVLSGAIYQEHWYLPQGKSWMAQLLEDAGSNYLWKNSQGIGSLSLSYEEVLNKAQNADFWIGPGQFTTFDEMIKSNGNYQYFKSFKNKNVFSYSSKKGKTGGLIYYELASNRPDLVLKDLVKIFHPDLVPNYQLYFLEKLQ
jgi:iron complex transport system substrate-binding protein